MTLVGLIFEHLDKLEQWSADLLAAEAPDQIVGREISAKAVVLNHPVNEVAGPLPSLALRSSDPAAHRRGQGGSRKDGVSLRISLRRKVRFRQQLLMERASRVHEVVEVLLKDKFVNIAALL